MDILPDRYSSGPLLLILGAAAGLVISIYYFITPLTGVNDTIGAGLVIFSTAIMLIAALIHPILPSGMFRATVKFLILVDAVCTIAAGYFLHEWFLIAFMVVALGGAIIDTVSGISSGTGSPKSNLKTQGAAA
nr:hypothetical protein [uncultured Cohaesibacter sp.]